MTCRIPAFFLLAIGITTLVPHTSAQKPAPPGPPAPSPTSGRSAPSSPTFDPTQPHDDLVMFLRGTIATRDGTPVPNNVLVERVCNNRVRQEVYASLRGDFSMQLGSRADSLPDAGPDPTSPYRVVNKDSTMGIPRRELTSCELRASASGFYSSVINLVDLDPSGGSVDVGVIVVRRGAKVEGNSISALPYKAPKEARQAYEKGILAEKKGKLDDAHRYLQTSVEIYPSSAIAWFRLGTVLQKQNQKDAARKAYAQATDIDTKFLPPYLSLASMAYEARNWTEVLELTGHILNLDPFNSAAATGYILDLDPQNYTGAYFYNAVANYQLNKFSEAEKSARKAEHLDLRPNFPQLHLLLAEIYARKNDYALAIGEAQTYLALVPHGKDAARAREQLANYEKLSAPTSPTEKPDR